MNKFIIIFIIYIFYKYGFIGKLINICLPFIIGLILAYIFYPLKNRSKLYIAMMIFLLIIIFILFKSLIPIISKELINLYNILSAYFTNVCSRYNLNIDLINNIFNYKNIISGITLSVNYIVNFILIIISFIYFLYYMDNIKTYIKKIKIYNYLEYINKDIRKYISSLIKISIVSFIEYTICFLVIGHKNYLLVGLLAGILNMIPYIGGIVTVFLTILLDPTKIIIISISYMILGLIDGYIIQPYFYGKYNKLNPLLLLFIISLSSIFGIIGPIFAIPLVVIITSTYRYTKEFKIDIKKILKI